LTNGGYQGQYNMMWKCTKCKEYFSVSDDIDVLTCPRCGSRAIVKP